MDEVKYQERLDQLSPAATAVGEAAKGIAEAIAQFASFDSAEMANHFAELEAKASQLPNATDSQFITEKIQALKSLSPAERLSQNEALGCLYGAMWGALYGAGIPGAALGCALGIAVGTLQ